MQSVVTIESGRRADRKAIRRRAFVVAARDCFFRNGYAGTSISDVIDAVGGSKATIYSYFSSKDELFAAVIDDLTEGFEHNILASLSVESGTTQDILLFCERFIQTTQSDEGVAAWQLVTAEAGRFPEIGRIFLRRAVEPVQASLAQLLDRCIAAGRLVPRPVEEMVDVLLNLCAGRLMRRAWDGSTTASPRQLAHIYVEVFLRAYGVAPPAVR